MAFTEILFKSKQEVAESTFLYTFSRPDGYAFSAGQYATMRFGEGARFADDRGNTRCFSLASAPYEDELSFLMRRSESGFKRNIHALEVGERAMLTGPVGKGTLEALLLGEQMVLIAAGVGYAPMRSLLREMIHRNSNKPCLLINSNRTPESTPEFHWMESLSSKYPHITIINTMTNPEQSSHSWRGETRRVDEVFLREYLSDTPETRYFIAAGSEFVRAIKKHLNTRDVPDSRIFFDNFG
jgi:ferredoxin-NADP reductase